MKFNFWLAFFLSLNKTSVNKACVSFHVLFIGECLRTVRATEFLQTSTFVIYVPVQIILGPVTSTTIVRAKMTWFCRFKKLSCNKKKYYIKLIKCNKKKNQHVFSKYSFLFFTRLKYVCIMVEKELNN